MSTLRSTFPTDEELDEALGFALPATMRTLLRIAFEEANDDLGEFLNSYFDVANFYFAGDLAAVFIEGPRESFDVRYTSTPPELCPFGCPGRDGAHYGFIVHAPELVQSDYLVGELAPADEAGVLIIGRNTDDAIRNLVSFTAESGERLAETRVADRMLNELKISLDEDRDPLWMKDEKVSPVVPAGYSFHETPDGVGVLAKSDAFSGALELPPAHAPLNSYLEAADRYLNVYHPGDALVLLKHASWHYRHEGGALRRLYTPMARTYDALDRPLFSRILGRNAARFSE